MMITSSPSKVSLPKKFLASGINSGMRRYRPDLGMIISEQAATTVGVFTQNSCKAAPVRYCESILPANNIRAIITNSGQANAATGAQGELDNMTMVHAAAQALNCDHKQILSASTGVIGQPLQIDKIENAIPKLVQTAVNAADKFALAILTTDLVPKWCVKTVQLSGGTINITGVCKGSGMIHPNMATMLAYFMSDIQLDPQQASTLLKNCVDVSFNMISVDGESSTNDSVFLMCNSASGVAPQSDDDLLKLQAAFTEVALHLAKSIVRDGEGATKFIEIEVKHAASQTIANQLARSLTTSPLIKTAVYGESPNWGRIIARMGMQSLDEDVFQQCDIAFQSVLVFSNGKPLDSNQIILSSLMKEEKISIQIDLKNGQHNATAWGCDLSEKYVKINADYLS